MDTIRDLKTKKRKNEHGSEKQSPGNTSKNINETELDNYTTIIDGEVYKMAEDLKSLPEIDYNDPHVQKWLAEERTESIQKYGKLTYEESEFMYTRRLELQKKLPEKSVEELNKIALAEFRTRPKV